MRTKKGFQINKVILLIILICFSSTACNSNGKGPATYDKDKDSENQTITDQHGETKITDVSKHTPEQSYTPQVKYTDKPKVNPQEKPTQHIKPALPPDAEVIAPTNSLKVKAKQEIESNAVEKFIGEFEEAAVKAVNEKNFDLVENYLAQRSFIYDFQQAHINNMSQRDIKKQMLEYRVKDIKAGKNGDEKDVLVYEKIKIIYTDKQSETKEYNWVYTVVTIKSDLKLKSFNVSGNSLNNN